MSQTVRFCELGGFVVGGGRRLPTDLSDYGLDAGCNSLRCESCGVIVRSFLPGRQPSDDRWPQARELYESSDPSTWLTHELPNVRTYACSCRIWIESGYESLINDHESPSDPNVPWRCAGHPTPRLPFTVGRFVIDENSNFPEVVATILNGEYPPPLPFRPNGPVQWLTWFYNYLRKLPEAESLAAAVAARIEDPDPVVHGRVLAFFRLMPTATGIERLVDIVERVPNEVCRSYPVPEWGTVQDAWEVLWRALSQRMPDKEPIDERIVALVKMVLTTPRAELVVDEVGMTAREVEAESMKRDGRDPADPWFMAALETVERLRAKFRQDGPMSVFMNNLSMVVDGLDDGDIEWFARSIVEIERAGTGRWRQIVRLLEYAVGRDRSRDAFLIIALIALIQSGAVPQTELRAWVDAYPYQREAFLVPVRLALDAAQAN